MKPVRFRLFPEQPGSLYVLVTVWATRQEMLKAGRHGGPLGRTCQGVCSPIDVTSYRNGKARKRPIFAEVHLWRGKLTMNVVTHELFHTTIAWARRVGFDFSRLDADDSINNDEERITYVHGFLCRDFMVRATDAGLYS